jgi:DNA-binding response OmpR family regulator
VHLTRTEFDLLAYLCRRSGRAVSRRHLADDVLPSLADADLRTIDTHIARIRRKLGAAGKQIRSVWGIGYRLEPKDAT